MTFPQGIYFRATDDQSDPANYDAEIGTTANYPRASAQGNNVGWEQAIGANVRDRNATTDVRLKGIHFADNTGGAEKNYRIALPSPGDYKVRLAAGDSASGQACKVELFDNSSSLGVLANAVTSGAGFWIDATGVERTSESDWVNNNSLSGIFTFATAICRVRIGGHANGPGSNTAIAAFYIEAASGGGASTGAAMYHHLRNMGAY